jgi:surface antigen
MDVTARGLRTRTAGRAAAGVAALLLAGCAAGPPPVKPTAGDLERLRAAEQEALEDARTGQSVNWHNPKTGHSGSVTVLRTRTEGETESGRPCRRIQRVFSADGTTRTGTAYACRTAGGDWTIEREDRLLTDDQRARSQRRALPYWPHHHRYPYAAGYPARSGVSIGVGVSGGL